MSNTVKNILERLPNSARIQIENRAKDTKQTEEDIIVEILSKQGRQKRFQDLNRKLASYGKGMTEEEILSLPRMPGK